MVLMADNWHPARRAFSYGTDDMLCTEIKQRDERDSARMVITG